MENFNRNNLLTVPQILKILDPKEKGTLDLQDMKSILCKFQNPISSSLREVFTSYIFQYKSFVFPISYLLMNYTGTTNTSNNSIESHRRLQSFESFDNSVTKSQTKRGHTRNGSVILTYSQIYKKKKNSERKAFQETQALYDKIDKKKEYVPQKKILNKENCDKNYIYPELIAVRKLHLRHSSNC